VADRPVRLAEVFYQHLFEMAPATRAMFAVDMTEQMQKMTDTLLAAIAQLSTNDTGRLEVVLHRMGREHYERYQVEPDHYTYIAHALTRAVRDVAGWEYTSYLSSCWIALSQWVTHHMIAGTRSAMSETSYPGQGTSGQANSAAIPSPRSAPVTRAPASTRSAERRHILTGRVRSSGSPKP
jgi:hemoglobin-like flavoprotein